MTLVDLLVVAIAKSLGLYRPVPSGVPVEEVVDSDADGESKLDVVGSVVNAIFQNVPILSDIVEFVKDPIMDLLDTLGLDISDIPSQLLNLISYSQLTTWWTAFKSSGLTSLTNSLNNLSTSLGGRTWQ